MSTRSQIAVRLSDGSYASIYCHHDGYPMRMGWMLHNKFNTPNRIISLVMDGRNIRNVGYRGNYGAVEYYPLGSSASNVHRYETLNDFLSMCEECLYEYAYVYEDGEFYCYYLKGHSVSEYSSEMEWEMRCLGKLSDLKCCTNSNYYFAEMPLEALSDLCI